MQQTITCLSRLGLNPLVLFLSANLLAGSGEAQTIFTDVTEQVGLDAFPRRSARNVSLPITTTMASRMCFLPIMKSP